MKNKYLYILLLVLILFISLGGYFFYQINNDNNDYSKLESLLNRITPTESNIIDTFVNLLDVLDANNTQYLKIAHVENFEELVYELFIAIDDMLSNKSVDSSRSGIRAKLNFVLDTYLLKTKIPQYIYNANYKSLSVVNLVNLSKSRACLL